MATPAIYIPSQTLHGDSEFIRQHSFTRWMSRDLRQTSVDFCRNLGLIPIYSEYSPDELTRILFWRPPQGAAFEVRSGRTLEQFQEFDRVNLEKGRGLVSLHVNENEMHSAVWISEAHYADASTMLAFLGITPAQRLTVE